MKLDYRLILIMLVLIFIAGCRSDNPEPNLWTIENNTVYIDNENLTIKVTPHTSVGNEPIQINFTMKIGWVDNYDILIGFNDSNVIVDSTSVWDDIFRSDTPVEINFTTYNYNNFTNWYYASNIQVQPNITYIATINLKIAPNTTGKYWIAIKLSNETFQQSIDNGNFYFLDPWYSSNYLYKVLSPANISSYVSSLGLINSSIYLINSTNGFKLAPSSNKIYAWGLMTSQNQYIYFNNHTDYVLVNSTESEKYPLYIVKGNGTDYNVPALFSSLGIITYYSFTNKSAQYDYTKDALGIRNLTNSNGGIIVNTEILSLLGGKMDFSISSSPRLQVTGNTSDYSGANSVAFGGIITQSANNDYLMTSDLGACGPSSGHAMALKKVAGNFQCFIITTTSGNIYLNIINNTVNQAMFVMCVFDNNGNNFTSYVNGNITASVPAVGDLSGDLEGLRFGGDCDAGSFGTHEIDEFFLMNKTPTASEIQFLSDQYFRTNFNILGENTTNQQVFFPYASQIKLNSTSPENFTTDNLLVEFRILTNVTGDNLLYNITWYKNNVLDVTFNSTSTTLQNNTLQLSMLGFSNTSVGENWSAQVQVCRQNSYCGPSYNSTSITIREFPIITSYSLTYNTSSTESTHQFFILNVSYYNATINKINATFKYNNTLYSLIENDYKNSPYSSKRFIANLITPNIIPPSETKSFIFNLSILFNNGTTIYNDTFIGTQEVIAPIIQQCGIGNSTLALVLNFTIRHEENESILSGAASANFLTYTINISQNRTYFLGNMNSISNFSLCIFPINFTSLKMNGQIQYQGPNGTIYDARDYYFRGYNLDNITDNIGLYLLDIARASPITFTVTDPNQVPIENALIYIMRYDVGNTSLRTIAMGLTNQQGQDLIFLRKNDAFYTIVIVQEDGTINVFPNQKIILDAVSISITSNELEEILETIRNAVKGIYVVNNATFHAYYNDSTGRVRQGCFEIQKIGTISSSFIFSQCIDAAQGSFEYTVPDNTSNYQAVLTLKINPLIDSIIYILNNQRYFLYENLGKANSMFLAILIFLAVIGTAMWSPVIGVMLGVACIIFMSSIGLFPVAYSSIVPLIIAAIMLIFRMRY